MKISLPFALAAAMVVVAAISSSAQNSVNSVDFKNFTYPAFCAGDEPEDITVRNSSFSRETVSQDGYTDRFYFEIIDIAIGDLDGDECRRGRLSHLLLPTKQDPRRNPVAPRHRR